jgi:hypothetical protein
MSDYEMEPCALVRTFLKAVAPISVRRIISGGLSGADTGALLAARALGHETGGVAA